MPQYGSKFRAFVVNIRPEVKVYHPHMPVVTNTIPRMAAEFGLHDGEFQYENPETGAVDTFANIRGFFYDLDADAKEKGWTDEEYQIAQARLDALCDTWPEAIWRLEAQAPTAPWPTYDNTPHGKVALLAGELGLVNEALAYEKYNKNRKSVIEALEAARQTAAVEEELTVA